MSYYPVYLYKENNNTPLSQSQVKSILSSPSVKIIDAVSGQTMTKPPGPNDLRSDGKPFHVCNYFPQTNEMVYHGINFYRR